MSIIQTIVYLVDGNGVKQPFYADWDGTAYVLFSQPYVNGVPVSSTNQMPVLSKPSPFTVISLNQSEVVTANQPIIALNAGNCTAGGLLITSDPNGFYVNQAGVASTSPSGSTFFIGAGVPFALLPSVGPVYVNATESGLIIQGYGLQ